MPQGARLAGALGPVVLGAGFSVVFSTFASLDVQAQALGSAAISGVVFDSVSRAGLAGAIVQVVSQTSVNRVFAGVADSTGHYRIAGVPFGAYIVGFHHRTLDALGLGTPQRLLRLTADTGAKLDLAVPSGAIVRALRCGGDSTVGRHGMAAGFVDDLQKSMPLPGAVVTAQWPRIATDEPHPRIAAAGRSAAVGVDGTYLLCELPVDVPLSIRVAVSNHRPVVSEITIPSAGARRIDFHLVDSSVAGGNTTLLGRVEQKDGSAVRSGRASMEELGIDVPISGGRFVMTGLPAGTWVVSARAVGLEPTSVLVNLEKPDTTSVTITLLDHAQSLEAVSITGKETRESAILRDVLFRKRFGAGTVFMPGNPWLQGASQIGDVVRAARGFHAPSPDVVVGRQPCTSGPSLRLFLNGEPFALGLAELNRMIPIRDVLAIEAYPDGAFAPFIWRRDKPCAVIAVWTNRR